MPSAQITERWLRDSLGLTSSEHRTLQELVAVLRGPQIGVKFIHQLRDLTADDALISLLPAPFTLADKGRILHYFRTTDDCSNDESNAGQSSTHLTHLGLTEFPRFGQALGSQQQYYDVGSPSQLAARVPGTATEPIIQFHGPNSSKQQQHQQPEERYSGSQCSGDEVVTMNDSNDNPVTSAAQFASKRVQGRPVSASAKHGAYNRFHDNSKYPTDSAQNDFPDAPYQAFRSSGYDNDSSMFVNSAPVEAQQQQTLRIGPLQLGRMFQVSTDDMQGNESGEEVQSLHENPDDKCSVRGIFTGTREKRPCLVPGCKRKDAGGGACQSHGGGRRCQYQGCHRGDAGGRYCVRHGGGKRCIHAGCSLSVRGNSKCLRHGGGVCRFHDCPRGNAGGGFCVKHGGGRRCGQSGCDRIALKGGFCRFHGGGEACSWAGCSETAYRRGLCLAHGGGKRICRYTGTQGEGRCSSQDAGGGYCIKHGGGKRCAAERCNKLDKGGGYCIKHGGGKRCRFPNCTKSGARRGFCVRHSRQVENSTEATSSSYL